MLKKMVALFVAVIFFLSAQTFAHAEEPDDANVVNEPFTGEQSPYDEPSPYDEQQPYEQPPYEPPSYEQPPYEPPSYEQLPYEQQQPYEQSPYDQQQPYEPPLYDPSQYNQPDDGEGLEFLVYHQNGVMAFAIIADHEKYQLRPILANGQVPGRATVSQMNSPAAIATINASYFDRSGTILGNTRIDGVTAGTTHLVRSALGIRADGSVIFARQAYRGVVQFGGREVTVSGIDCERNPNSVVVYNGWQGRTTRTNNFGVEIVVRDGQVVDILRDVGNSYIPPDGFVVSAHGAAAQEFSSVQIGDAMTFDEDFINVEHGADFNEAIHILGAGPTLVKNGEIYVTADAEQFPNDIRVGRAPRSAFGVTQYGDYIFAVVDGRQAHSKGCTLTEWARILKFTFGAVNAINLDGGGSSELVFKGSLVNRPSDGRERPVGDGLTILRR